MTTYQDQPHSLLRSGTWQSAEQGRLECALEFEFGKDWNGRRYERKKVTPVFVEEESEIVVITVYTFYLLNAFDEDQLRRGVRCDEHHL